MMINNRCLVLFIVLIALLTSGSAIARKDDGRRGSDGTGGTENIKNDYAEAGDDSSGYPRRGYYYGNPESDFFRGSSFYEPYYAYPPQDDEELASQTFYIEQRTKEKTPAAEPDYWDYCAENKSYFPYVKECPTKWQKIEPQPFGQEPGYWYYCYNPAGYYPYVRQCASNWKKIVL